MIQPQSGWPEAKPGDAGKAMLVPHFPEERGIDVKTDIARQRHDRSHLTRWRECSGKTRDLKQRLRCRRRARSGVCEVVAMDAQRDPALSCTEAVSPMASSQLFIHTGSGWTVQRPASIIHRTDRNFRILLSGQREPDEGSAADARLYPAPDPVATHIAAHLGMNNS